MDEEKLHELARLFMNQFKFKRDVSLDEFLFVHEEDLSIEERVLGNFILEQFN